MTQQPSSELFALQQAVAGHFAIEREVGRGGMGIVFLARDLTLDRPVAIKLLAPPLAAEPSIRSRFLNEARTAARLSHPNIVPVHAVEDRDGLVFIILAYVDGETLGQRVRRAGPLSRADGLRVVREVAWALGHAHATGIVHRDVKPDNVLLEAHNGRALVTDFGIAGLAGEAATSGVAPMGTPHYMSPERIEGGPGDARSDLYGLGVTAFFALTGRLPFDGDSVREILLQHLHTIPPPIGTLRPDLPDRFAAAVDRCLRKDPDDRFPTAEALLEELGAAGAQGGEAPPAVATFVRDARALVGDIGASWLAAGTSLAIYAAFFRGDMFAAIAFYPIAALLAGVGLFRFGELVLGTRQLLRQGYSHAAVRPAALLEQRQEEATRTPEAPGIRALTERPVPMALIGAVKTALFVWLATSSNDTLRLIGIVGAVLMPTATLRQAWRVSHGARGFWARLLQGRFGRFLFRVARLGIGRTALPVAADAPTALLLGEAAERLFQALPAEQRRAFADLPAVIERLQADALAPADGTAAKARRSTALAAMESLRLDLLRLQAGEVQRDQLTQDLDAARRLARSVDRLLDGT